MIPQRIRRAAAALALAATLALAAPAHAAGWEDLGVGPGWIEQAMEWIARLWIGGEARGSAPAIEKCGGGINPDGVCSGGAPSPQPPAASPSGGSGSGG